MKPTRIKWTVAYVAFVLATAIRPGVALTLPNDLTASARDLQSAWQATKIPEAQSLAQSLADRICLWAVQAAASASTNEIIAAFDGIVPVRTNVQSQVNVRDDAYPTHTEQLILRTAQWVAANRTVLVLTVDYLFREGTSGPVYLKSRAPVLIARGPTGVTAIDVKQWQGMLEPTRYFTHGFLPAPAEHSWPDVLISAGPVGHGLFFYFLQVHLKTEPEKWEVVWEHNQAYVERIQFTPGVSKLVVEFGLGRDTDQNAMEVAALKHGQAASMDEGGAVDGAVPRIEK